MAIRLFHMPAIRLKIYCNAFFCLFSFQTKKYYCLDVLRL